MIIFDKYPVLAPKEDEPTAGAEAYKNTPAFQELVDYYGEDVANQLLKGVSLNKALLKKNNLDRRGLSPYNVTSGIVRGGDKYVSTPDVQGVRQGGGDHAIEFTRDLEDGSQDFYRFNANDDGKGKITYGDAEIETVNGGKSTGKRNISKYQARQAMYENAGWKYNGNGYYTKGNNYFVDDDDVTDIISAENAARDAYGKPAKENPIAQAEPVRNRIMWRNYDA